MPAPESIKLVYDGDCPVCRFYATRVDTVGSKLELVNARDGGALVDEITEAGVDIDAGMVVKVGDDLYFGSDAVQTLASMSTTRDVFNRLTAGLFRSSRLARVFYPPLVGGRKILLRILGRTKINNLGNPDNDRF